MRHWFKRIFFGLFITLGGLVAVVGSLILFFDPQTKNPLVAQTIGVVMGLLAIWVLSLAFRVLFNRQQRGGGLFSPWLLRLFAAYFVAMPTFMLVTGRSASWHALEYLHAGLSYLSALGLWRLAAFRSIKAQSREA